VEMVNTQIVSCRFHWRGPALKTIQLLQNMGLLKTGPLPVPSQVEIGKVN
jgi:hypothetical protein